MCFVVSLRFKKGTDWSLKAKHPERQRNMQICPHVSSLCLVLHPFSQTILLPSYRQRQRVAPLQKSRMS